MTQMAAMKSNRDLMFSPISAICVVRSCRCPPIRSRQRHVLELELQRDRHHLARRLVDELVVGRLAGGVDEEVFEAELAAVGARVGEAAVVLEPRAVGLLEPEAVVEQALAVALERRALAGVGELDVDLPDLLVDLGRLRASRRCRPA